MLDGPARERLAAAEKELYPFFTEEDRMRTLIRNGQDVTESAINALTLRKSTDVFLYASIPGDIPTAIERNLYLRQLFRDCDDDFRDLGEDSERGNPNPLLLRLYRRGHPIRGTQEELSRIVEQTGVGREHLAFIRTYAGRP